MVGREPVRGSSAPAKDHPRYGRQWALRHRSSELNGEIVLRVRSVSRTGRATHRHTAQFTKILQLGASIGLALSLLLL